MKAIVVTNQAAGTAGMKLVERPEPPAAINDVIVQVHASGFVPTELEWPSTWTDRRDRDRTPSILGHELHLTLQATPGVRLRGRRVEGEHHLVHAAARLGSAAACRFRGGCRAAVA